LGAPLGLTSHQVGNPGPGRAASGRQDRARDDRAHAGQGGGGGEKPGSLQDLERDLRASRPETRRSVVKKLAALNDRKAWDLVVEALADGDPMVADEAQVALGDITDRKLAADLLGPLGLHAKDAWV